MAQVSTFVNSTLAHLPGVKNEVHAHGQGIAARARAIRGQHRDTGAARIRVVRQSPDYLVCLDDQAAIAIELGGVRRDGRVIRGLFILTRAAEL